MRYRYTGYAIRSRRGVAHSGAAVDILEDLAGTTLASITNAGGSAIANPTTANDRGQVDVYSTLPVLYYRVAGDPLVQVLPRLCDLTPAETAVGDFPNAVRDFGAVGNGTADDTTRLNDALEQSDGLCVLPAGRYKVTDSLVPVTGHGFIGGGYNSVYDGGIVPPVLIVGDGGFPIIDGSGETVVDFTLKGLGLKGSASAAGSMGIKGGVAHNWTLRDLFGDSFADQGVYLPQGIAGVFQNLWFQNCCADVAHHTGPLGAIQFGEANPASGYMTDLHCHLVGGYCGGWNGQAGEYDNGYHCGLLIAAATSVFEFCYGSWSETGVKVVYGDFSQFTNTRADHNQGAGWDIYGGGMTFMGCLAQDNSLVADQAHAGFRVRSGGNLFDLNRIGSTHGATRRHSYGFEDDADAGAWGNYYGAGNIIGDVPGGLYHVTSWGESPVILGHNGRSLDVANSPAYNGRGAGYTINGGAGLFAGAGSPEGAVTAAVGSLYMRTDGGANTSVYVKESGTGNTGWQPK